MLSLFAAAVIIAELAVFIPSLSSLNPFAKLMLMDTFIALDSSLMLVMSYIAFCVYYSLFKLKFASYYGLYWNHQTDASSLIFFAMYAIIYKVIAPEFRLHYAITFYKSLMIKKLHFLKLWEKRILFQYSGRPFMSSFPFSSLFLLW